MSLHDDPSPDRRDESSDDIARLIRLTDRRSAVPDNVAARVRAAAHEHWQGELRRRARTHSLWPTAALAMAASVVLVIGWSIFRIQTAGPSVPPAAGRVESLVGSGSVRVGAEVSVGAEVETGEEGRLAVRLASGHSVRLDASSRIRILERDTLALDRGAVYVDSGGHAPKAGPLNIRTPLGDVREVGTQFEVRLGMDSVRIRVREGAVVVRAADGLHVVRVATELEVDGRGTPRTREISRSDPEWAWIADVAPMPDLEGLSARAFLDWAAREGGWTLRFADEETARFAAETTLRGSLAGLTPEQALDAVLPTCGLNHRIENGRLIVERSGG